MSLHEVVIVSHCDRICVCVLWGSSNNNNKNVNGNLQSFRNGKNIITI